LYKQFDCVTQKATIGDKSDVRSTGEGFFTRSTATCPDKKFLKSFKNRNLNKGWRYVNVPEVIPAVSMSEFTCCGVEELKT
jgi:hypothetical protein